MPTRIRIGLKFEAGITEAKIEFWKQKYKADDNQIIVAQQIDDTGIYTEWALKNLVKGIINETDIEKIRNQLIEFSRLKKSPEFKTKHSPDINQYTPEKLYEVTQKTELLSKNEQERNILKNETELIYQDEEGYTAYLAKSPEALVLLGSNSNWCTNQIGTAKTYFERGPLVVIKQGTENYCQIFYNKSYGNFQIMNKKDQNFSQTIRRGIKHKTVPKVIYSVLQVMESKKIIPTLGDIIAPEEAKSIKKNIDITRKNFKQEILDNNWKKLGKVDGINIYKYIGSKEDQLNYHNEFFDRGDTIYSFFKNNSYLGSCFSKSWNPLSKNLGFFTSEGLVISNPEIFPALEYLYQKNFIEKSTFKTYKEAMEKTEDLLDFGSAADLYKIITKMGVEWPEAEIIIRRDPIIACKYAIHVLKHRWLEAEKGIFKKGSEGVISQYLKTFFKGEDLLNLPELAIKRILRKHWGSIFEEYLNILTITKENVIEAIKKYMEDIDLNDRIIPFLGVDVIKKELPDFPVKVEHYQDNPPYYHWVKKKR
jgi:hypothetical protein